MRGADLPRLLAQQWFQHRQQGLRNDLGAFGGGMNSILLNRARHTYKVFVDHGNQGGVVPRCQIGVHLIELVNIVGPVIGGQGDAGQQYTDVRSLKRRQHLIEVAPGLVKGQAAQTVIAAKFNNCHRRMQADHSRDLGNRVLAGGAAGPHVLDFVVVSDLVEIPLQRGRVGLLAAQAIAGGDAVAKADQHGAIRASRREKENQKTQ